MPEQMYLVQILYKVYLTCIMIPLCILYYLYIEYLPLYVILFIFFKVFLITIYYFLNILLP
jgi:hypothetical protein